MKDSKPLGIAIVGFGGMGSQHAGVLQKVAQMQLTGTYDIKAERQRYAETLGYTCYPSYEALLDDGKVDVVLIATPNHLHKPLSLAALRAGKHVICEKPVTLNVAELEEIIAEAECCHRVFTVHQNRRWDEDFRAAKKLYDDQSLGEVFTIESRVMGSQGIPGDWRTHREFGGGMLLDWGVHLTDQLLWMLPTGLEKIYCRLGYRLGGECDDSVRLLLTFANGLEALVEVGTWNMEGLPRWYMAGMSGAMTIQDLWFSKSSVTRLRKEVLNNTRPIDAGKGITRTMAPRDPDTLENAAVPHVCFDVCDFYRNVADTIEGKADLIVKPQESLRVMRVLDAARRSAALDAVIAYQDTK